MRFLADECLHAEIVGWMRARGLDVLYAAEDFVGETDDVLLRRARDEDRIIVTDDKDFGDLVVHGRRASSGVLLLRQGSASVADRVSRLEALWPEIGPRLAKHLVVVSDTKVRIRPLSR